MKKAKFKKSTKKRLDVPRPRNGGEWTEARFISFIKSALRGARWPQKYVCIKNAYIEDGINPKTGRKCKLHKCPQCEDLVTQNEMVADHIVPVVGPEGFIDWNTFIARLFCEADGFQAVCKKCHTRITNHESKVRKETNNSQLKLI
jgi:hypothetical protein